ncbi:hypothetical protein DOM22_10930 [Bdellovibrio sp. ZAP7]|uniref:hypothetical protein n=1 Tax=Bdellovibrio sp. ZAP7 TaxID=2231053 RepID=UPI00115B8461|nr:hypothetical protein [Bdellovibrio sp. ZAP7]QDK45625.1 hypothetical protein DOM22_10930 [Bdellovibrio sp. ZAP7]
MKSFIVLFIFISLTFLVTDAALARDAVEMGVSAQIYFLRIGVATVGIVITIAGILYSFGLGIGGGHCLLMGIGAAILKIFSSIIGTSL